MGWLQVASIIAKQNRGMIWIAPSVLLYFMKTANRQEARLFTPDQEGRSRRVA
jgi:hypothetical protein